jgi:MFS family permease
MAGRDGSLVLVSTAVKIARDSLSLFKRRDFGLLMGAQWLAQFADGLVAVSLAKYIVFGGQAGFDIEQAREAEEMLRIALLTFLPYAVISPLIGVLIDRWDRRKMLIVANAARAVLLGGVALVGIEVIGPAALYGSFLMILAGTRLLLAIKGASLPAVLGERDLLHGNSVSQAGSALFQVSGAGIGLVASAMLATEVILIGGVAAYAVGTVAGFLIRRLGYATSTVPFFEELRRLFRDLAEGIREMTRRPMAALSLGSFLMIRGLFTFVVLSVALASQQFIVEEDSLTRAIPAIAGAFGAAVGFFAAHSLKDRMVPERIVVAAMLVAAIGLFVFGGIINLVSLSLVALVMGLAFFLGKVSADTLMQEGLDDSFRGRGFGLLDLAYNLSWILPTLVLSLAWSVEATRALLIGAGIMYLLLGVVIGLWSRSIRAARPAPVVEGVEPTSPADRPRQHPRPRG